MEIRIKEPKRNFFWEHGQAKIEVIGGLDVSFFSRLDNLSPIWYNLNISTNGITKIEFDNSSSKNSDSYLLVDPLEDRGHFVDVFERWEEIRSEFAYRIIGSRGDKDSRRRIAAYRVVDQSDKRRRYIPEREKSSDNCGSFFSDDAVSPPIILGDSIDGSFNSDGCLYVVDSKNEQLIPYRQHYHHGKFDFYLFSNEIKIVDPSLESGLELHEMGIPFSDRGATKSLLDILGFIGDDPESAVDRFLGIWK